MDVTAIAQVCHEANRAIQVIQNHPQIPVGEHWEELDVETRESAVNGVQGILDGNNPEESHMRWVAFKEENGWRYGDIKDEDRKTHPLLVPYAELPADQQIKDALFYHIVIALADREFDTDE